MHRSLSAIGGANIKRVGDRVRQGVGRGLPAIALTALIASPVMAQEYPGFAPPVSAVREPRLALDVVYGPLHSDDTYAAVVNVGGRFVLGAGPFDSLFELSPGIVAQFDLPAPSMQLVNADYRIGLGFSRSTAAWEGRLEVYHQSSHLGDEYLLREDPERVALAFEAVELLLGYRMGGGRIYGGAERRLGGSPPELPWVQWVGGLEWRASLHMGARPIVAWHSLRERGGDRGSNSYTLGLEWGPQGPRRHALRASLVHYQGNSPFGQFYTQRIRYTGIALELLY